MNCLNKELFKKWEWKIKNELSNSADPIERLCPRHAVFMNISYPLDRIIYEKLRILSLR
jgi:hypothetical protein